MNNQGQIDYKNEKKIGTFLINFIQNREQIIVLRFQRQIMHSKLDPKLEISRFTILSYRTKVKVTRSIDSVTEKLIFSFVIYVSRD